MINNNLQKEIVNHIFKSFAIFEKNQITMFSKLNDEQFLINKKIAFESEDGSVVEHKIYSYYTKLSGAEIKLIAADISEEYDEFVIILKMDQNPACALRMSLDKDDLCSFYMNLDGSRWINPGTSLHARILMVFEALSEIPANWEKTADYNEMYKSLVCFLNFYETENG